MKFIKSAAIAALLGSSIVSSPAFAAVTVLDTVTPNDATPTTLAAMQTKCDDLAAVHGTTWTGTLDETTIVANATPVSGPTESGTHSIADAIDGTLVGAGTFTPAHLEILGDPFRNGGSVNMFGIQQSVGGHYSASQYDFEGQFDTTFEYSFTCKMKESVTTPATGHHIWTLDPSDPNAAACLAFDKNGLFQGEDQAHCLWVVDSPGGTEDQDRADEFSSVNQTQTDTLLAHEDAGEGFDTDETLIIGQVVVCISPSKTGTKLPGSWVQQNGYTGDKCTTTWYNGGAMVGVPNLNDGSHNFVTVPVV